MPKYQFVVLLPTVEAETENHAKFKVLKLLENLASSNDGSEFLANAEPELMVAGVLQ